MKLKALSMTSAIPGSAQPTELTSQLGVGHSEFGQFFFKPSLFSLLLEWFSLLQRSHSISALKPQFTYMIYIYSQPSIHHLSGLLRTNMMTSLQFFFSFFMANVWRVEPEMERCGFEFWQRLSFLFCLGAGCKFLYFKNHWHDRMEIEESKVNAELSQVRDIYVWVTTVYFGPNQTCFVQHHVGGACTTTYT